MITKDLKFLASQRRIPVLTFFLLQFIAAVGTLGQPATPVQQTAPNEINIKDCGADIRMLAQGAAVESRRTIGPGEVQCYRIKLLKDQYTHIEVIQRGVDVLVQLFTLAGAKVGAVIDSPNGRDGSEPISEVADSETEYVIVIKSQDSPHAGEPKYTIEVKELRQATAADRIYVKAERAFQQGQLDLASGKEQLIPAAAGNLEEARKLLQPGPDPKPAIWVQLLNQLGYANQIQGRTDQAQALYSELREYTRRFPNPNFETIALIGLGTAYANKGEAENADAGFKNATEVAGAVSPTVRAKAWEARGNWYFRTQDVLHGVEAFEHAADSYRAANDFNQVADTYTNLGITSFNRSALFLARTYYEKALGAGASNTRVLGYASYNLGVALTEMGEFQSAMDAFGHAQKFYEDGRKDGAEGEAEYQRALPHVLKGIGFANSSLGDDVTAQALYKQALSLSEVDGKVIYADAAAYTHLYFGLSAYRLGQTEVGETETNKAFALFDKLQNDRGRANALANVGKSYYDAGKLDQALALLTRAASLQSQDLFGLAYTKTNIGRIMLDNGQPAEAIKTLREAWDLRRSVGDRSGEAITLYTLALAETRLGDLTPAFEHIDAARGIVEEIRQNVANVELRASYRAAVDKIYKLYVDVLMRQERIPQALEFEDNARARSLTETLSSGRVNLWSGLDTMTRQKRQSLIEEILSLAGKRQLLGRRMQASPAALELNQEIDKRRAQLRAIEEEALRDPKARSLVRPTPLSTEQISGLLDPETVLLEYSLGDERSYLWLITSASAQPVTGISLPERKKIDDLGRRVRQLLITPQLDQKGLIDYQQLSREFSSMLLGKVATEIKGKRLVIAADGILQYIPFSALPEPGISDWQPLFLAHEVVNVPSAAALSAVRTSTGNRVPASQTLALLADPVYLPPKGVVASEPNASKKGEASLRPLAFAKDEMQRIKKAYAKLENPKGLKELTDYEANRTNAISSTLADFRVIHYSAHGVADDLRPEASGIYFTRYDRHGKATPNFVGLDDVYGLKLSADLVVLSACETALGKEVKGEGIVGLTRGFMYAGSTSVLSSLWEVNEFHTANLMGLFYKGMFEGKQPPAAALRLAQREMWRQKLPPYYWAGFNLQGEWRLKQPF
jgi:CHAT domain-containing protein/Tfp pilus assembly protein PilF